MNNSRITFEDPRKEIFCRELVRTGNQDEAYRIATGKKKGDNTTNSMRWSKDPLIRERITQIHNSLREDTVDELAEHVKNLANLRDAAAADGSWSAAINAEVSRGKALGLYDRNKEQEKSLENMTTTELITKLEAMKMLPKPQDYIDEQGRTITTGTSEEE